jgi:hypothetical protein
MHLIYGYQLLTWQWAMGDVEPDREKVGVNKVD